MKRVSKQIIDITYYEESPKDFLKRVEERIYESLKHRDEVETFFGYTFTNHQQKRALRLAKQMLKARDPETKTYGRLKREDLAEINAANQRMSEVHALLDDVDLAFSKLHAEFPWLSELTKHAWMQARNDAGAGRPVKIGPLIILGPPGVGKSSWARRIAQLLQIPSIDIDAGSTGGIFEIQGTDLRFSNAAPGRVMLSLITEAVANPLVIIDEIDAGSSVAGSNDRLPGLYKVLMGMIETSTAKSWTCPYYCVSVDMTGLSWVMTTNRLTGIERALIDRCKVIEVQPLTREQLSEAAAAMAIKKLGPDFADTVQNAVLQSAGGMSLRHISRLIEALEQKINMPDIH